MRLGSLYMYCRLALLTFLASTTTETFHSQFCAEMAQKLFTFQEAANHNKNGDCWLIIDAKVYDVSAFLDEHPGGDEVMLNSAGKDATADFEDIGHTSFAQDKMKEFLIGNIDESTLPPSPTITGIAPPTAVTNKNSDDSSSSKLLLYVLPLFILGVALLLRYYSQIEDLV